MLPLQNHLILIVLIYSIEVNCFDLSSLRIIDREPVSEDLEVEFTPIHRQRRSIPNDPPDELHAKFITRGEENILKLERTKWRHARVPFHYYSQGIKYKHVADENPQCVSIYSDLESRATALVDFCTISTREPQMMIHLSINNTQHVMMPDKFDDKKQKTLHTLYRVEEPIGLFGNDYFSSDENAGVLEEKELKRQRRATLTTRHTVELALVLDYSLYSFWYDRTSGTGRHQQAGNNIVAFYAFIVSAVDLRYQELLSSGLNIRVELVDIRAATTPEDSPWIDSRLEDSADGSRRTFNGSAALSDFEEWMKLMIQTDSSFPKHDAAILLTARDLVIYGLLGAAGFANLGAVCTDKGQAIAEDHFNFLSITIMTHELGHGLGAVHDGDGNDCLETDRFIMAAQNTVMTGAKSRNPWLFSSCSVTSITEKLTSLNQNESTNCLISNDNVVHIEPPGTMLGQLYSPDQQCQMSQPDGESVLCKMLHTGAFENICTGMWCSIGGLGNCSLVIPADGTLCGNHSWCLNGQCVNSTEAPDADEACLFGDQLGEITNGMGCSGLVAADPSNCYRTMFRSPCCASCASAHTNMTGCEYGDRQNCSAISSYSCYNETRCCKTCSDFKRHDLPTDCEYGDKASNCVANQILCEQFPDECCDTCKVIINKTTIVTTSTTTVGSTTAVDTSTSDTTTDTTTTATTAASSTELEDWVIPVAASVGGVVLLGICSGIACCCRRSKSAPRYRRSYNNRSYRQRYENRDYDNWRYGRKSDNNWSYAQKFDKRNRESMNDRYGPHDKDLYGFHDVAYDNPAAGYFEGNMLRY